MIKNKYIDYKFLNDYINLLNKKSRKRDIVYFRISLSYILYNDFNFNKNKIAKLFNLNHSTIIYYINKFNDYIIYDDFLKIHKKVSDNFKNSIIDFELNNSFLENNIIDNILYILKKHKKSRTNLNFLIKKYWYYEYISKHRNFNCFKYYTYLDSMTNISLILNKLDYIKNNNLFNF